MDVPMLACLAHLDGYPHRLRSTHHHHPGLIDDYCTTLLAAAMTEARANAEQLWRDHSAKLTAAGKTPWWNSQPQADHHVTTETAA